MCIIIWCLAICITTNALYMYIHRYKNLVHTVYPCSVVQVPLSEGVHRFQVQVHVLLFETPVIFFYCVYFYMKLKLTTDQIKAVYKFTYI